MRLSTPSQSTADFKTDRAFSDKLTGQMVFDALKPSFPAITRIERANLIDDIAGVDWWLYHPSGRFGVDGKTRRTQTDLSYPDTVILEIWSNKQEKKKGWTLDPSKKTDIVLWWSEATGKTFWLPFRPLRDAFVHNGKEWAQKYYAKSMWDQWQRGKDYTSRAIPVPVPDVLAVVSDYDRCRCGTGIPDGMCFCRMPLCTLPARYPCRQPIWCGQHFQEAYGWNEPEDMKIRRLAMEKVNEDARARDLNAFKARNTPKSIKPVKVKKGDDTQTVGMEL